MLNVPKLDREMPDIWVSTPSKFPGVPERDFPWWYLVTEVVSSWQQTVHYEQWLECSIPGKYIPKAVAAVKLSSSLKLELLLEQL